MKCPCANCGKPASQTCGGCDLEVYCDDVCQKEHWTEHQQSCDNESASVDVRFGRSKDMTVTAYLALKRDFKTLADLIDKQQLEIAVDTKTGVTLLAPDNKAFEIFLKNNKPKLQTGDYQKILLYHVLEGKNSKKDILALVKDRPKDIGTAQGSEITLSYSERRKQVLINGDAAVTRPDILVKNSVIHRIDTVLVPQEIADRLTPK